MPWIVVLVVVSLSLSPFCFAANDSEAIARIFSKKSDAVVVIAVDASDGNRMGSGFFINQNGMIVTNYHLVSGAREVIIKLKDNSVYRPRRIVNLDPERDIAVIQIDARPADFFRMGDSNAVVVGQRVFTIGSPLGLESSVADGLISSVREGERGNSLLQISVPLSQGSSGGPLLNLRGDVIGITTAGFHKGQNLNFAVPINDVRTLLNKPFDPRRFKQEIWPNASVTAGAKIPKSTDGTAKSCVVHAGDTLYGLAKKHRTTVKELIRLNHLKDSKIYSGQKLILP